MDSVFAIAESGDGYTALQKANHIVRNYKQRGEITEAMLFLMKLAHKLADCNKWQDASAAALKSISIFPSDATTIRSSLLSQFKEFVTRADKNAATNEFFNFTEKLLNIYKDEDHTIFSKQVEVAESANEHFRVQCIIYAELRNNEYEIEDIDRFKDILVNSSWKWVMDIDENERELNGMFIVGRILMGLLANKDNGTSLYDDILLRFIKTKPKVISEGFMRLPLFNCLTLLRKAVSEKNKAAAEHVINNYKQLFDCNNELKKLAKEVKLSIQVQNEGQSGNIMSNLFQMFGGLGLNNPQ